MNLRQLEIFQTIIKEGSFTGAAKKLDMAQPAVSIAIRKLEQELGFSLLKRADIVTATTEGNILISHAQKLLGDMQLAKQAMTDLHELQTGLIRFSTSPMLGSYFFPQKIKQFKQQYPGIDFQVINQGTINARKILDSQLCDMAVVDLDKLDSDIQAIPFKSEEIVACISPDHHLANKKSLHLEEFLQEPLILYRQDYAMRRLVDEASSALNIPTNIVMETDLLGMIKYSILEGNGVGLCLKMMADKEKIICSIPFVKPLKLNLGLGWKKDSYLSAANRAFIQYLNNGNDPTL